MNTQEAKETTMKKPPSGLQTTVSQLLAGMDANNDALAARGATPEFVKSGQTLLDKLASLESERDKLMDTLRAQQEAAKAAIKAKKAAIAVRRKNGLISAYR